MPFRLRTRRMPEDTARYLTPCGSLRDRGKYAKDTAEDYSDVARMLGASRQQQKWPRLLRR